MWCNEFGRCPERVFGVGQKTPKFQLTGGTAESHIKVQDNNTNDNNNNNNDNKNTNYNASLLLPIILILLTTAY